MSIKKARKYISKKLDELFVPFEKMNDKEKKDYLQTENKMLKQALEEADKINLSNKPFSVSMKMYSASLVYTKLEYGKINTSLYALILGANSKHEALGLCMDSCDDEFKDWSLSCKVVLEIEDKK